MVTLDTKDIQGLVFSGFAKHSLAAYLLLGIREPAGARRWLGTLPYWVTFGEKHARGSSLQVAFTSLGLRTLGLDEESLATFPREFLEGMATETRARILGDSGSSAPDHWDWGGSAATTPHILLIVFAPDAATLDSRIARYLGNTLGSVELARRIDGFRPDDGKEHFGFADGMGQPLIEGAPVSSKAKQLAPEVIARDRVPAGEFILGYPDTYGSPSRGPTVAAARDPKHFLEPAAGGAGDLGLNATYLVFRQLKQDVAALEAFLAAAAPAQADRDLLAAKMVGRWPSGAPLVKAPERDDPRLGEDNDFGYQSDKLGLRCPVGSHIRRANPRDSLGDSPAVSLASVNRHRILRRGRLYGPRSAPGERDGAERGLLFLCLNADIQRQFEFVQQTWINNTVFGGLCGERDPLLGENRAHDSWYTTPAQPVRRRAAGLPRLVDVRGGAYFFLPGLRALHYLASL